MTANAHERRAADQPVYTRVLRFLLAPLVDYYRGLSLTRLLAIGVFLVVSYVAIVSRQYTWAIFGGHIASLSAAFGKGVFAGKFLDRVQFGVTGSEVQQRTDTHVTIDETQRIITERRDHDLGIEPAP